MGDFAEVDGVAQHAEHGLGAPEPAAAGALTGVVEPVGQAGGAAAFVDVPGEHGADDGCFVWFDGECFGGGVEVVAVGAGAAEPFPAGGFAFEPFW